MTLRQMPEMYLQSMEDLKIDGTEELNGYSTSIVSGVLWGESMRDAMASSGIESIRKAWDLRKKTWKQFVTAFPICL